MVFDVLRPHMHGKLICCELYLLCSFCFSLLLSCKLTINMKYIKGQNRTQTFLFPVSLEDAAEPENEVRLIDVFVNGLKLDEFGFRV